MCVISYNDICMTAVHVASMTGWLSRTDGKGYDRNWSWILEGVYFYFLKGLRKTTKKSRQDSRVLHLQSNQGCLEYKAVKRGRTYRNKTQYFICHYFIYQPLMFLSRYRSWTRKVVATLTLMSVWAHKSCIRQSGRQTFYSIQTDIMILSAYCYFDMNVPVQVKYFIMTKATYWGKNYVFIFD